MASTLRFLLAAVAFFILVIALEAEAQPYEYCHVGDPGTQGCCVCGIELGEAICIDGGIIGRFQCHLPEDSGHWCPTEPVCIA